MSPRHPQNSLGRLCLRAQTRIPSRPERKKRPLYILPTHLWAVANRPLPCNVGGFGIPLSNKKGTIFSHRETCPQLGSAGNQHCIDWGCGGAARRGWRGRFFRSGRTRVRWCCNAIFVCVCVLCGAWMPCRAGRLQARATDGRETLGLRSKPRRPLRLTHIEERTRLSHLDRTRVRCCCRKCAPAWGFCRSCRNRVGTA